MGQLCIYMEMDVVWHGQHLQEQLYILRAMD